MFLTGPDRSGGDILEEGSIVSGEVLPGAPGLPVGLHVGLGQGEGEPGGGVGGETLGGHHTGEGSQHRGHEGQGHGEVGTALYN